MESDMLIRPNDRARDLLAQSFPIMKRNQDALADGVAAYLRTADRRTSADDSVAIATMLVALILDEAGRLVGSGAVRQPRDVLREHDAMGVQGRHYSCFGDALVPVIRDVLGRGTPREVTSAWVDAFWATIRAIRSSPAQAAA